MNTTAATNAVFDLVGYILECTIHDRDPDELPTRWTGILRDHTCDAAGIGIIYATIAEVTGRMLATANGMTGDEMHRLQLADDAPAHVAHAGRWLCAAMNGDQSMSAALWANTPPGGWAGFLHEATTALTWHTLSAAKAYIASGRRLATVEEWAGRTGDTITTPTSWEGRHQ